MQQLVLECAVRAALLAAGTAGVLWVLRVHAAWARHAAWTGVLILMLFLPTWVAWGPKAQLHLLPAAPPVSSVAPETLAVRPWSGPVNLATALPLAPAHRPAWNWVSCFACLYLVGVGVLLGRLLTGTARARLLVRRAVFRNGRLTSDACSAPVTVGGWTPVVILPTCWRSWPQTQLAAVLAHEAAHARRRDPLVQWLALFNRAVFWFHPLAWWLDRRLSALAEEACDAAVLEGGCDPQAYSEYLLEIARSVLQTGTRIKALGMAMPGSFLSRRIRWILERRPPQRITRFRLTGLGVACAAVAAVCTAGAVDRRAAERQAPPVVARMASRPYLSSPALAQAPISKPPAQRVRRLLTAEAQTAPAPPPPQTAVPDFQNWRLLVLYFDLQTMPAAQRTRALLAAQMFVRTRMQDRDLISVITANPEVKVLQDFTQDRDALVSTLDKLLADSAPDRLALPEVDRQIAGLQTAVHMLGALKQKKALIYFAAELGIDPLQLKPLIDEAIRANLAFYTMDARGQIEVPPADKNYVIASLDKVQVWVRDQAGITGQYLVRPDGVISMPLIGEVKAAGRTTVELEAAIAGALQANGILENPKVTVGIETVHGRN